MEISVHERQRLYAFLSFVVFSLSASITRVFTLRNGISGDAQLPFVFFDLAFAFMMPPVVYLLAKADIEQR